MNTPKRLYIVDDLGGWQDEFRVPIIISSVYAAVFIQNMLAAPTSAELDLFMGCGKDEPFVIYDVGYACAVSKLRT